MQTNYKKVSSHGSVSIPVAMRREIGLQGKDPVEVSLKQDGIIEIKPYAPRCMFCESTEEVGRFHGKGVCKSCATKVSKEIGGREEDGC